MAVKSFITLTPSSFQPNRLPDRQDSVTKFINIFTSVIYSKKFYKLLLLRLIWSCDIQKNDTQHSDTQHNTQYNESQQNDT
jgi:hypothetical protein